MAEINPPGFLQNAGNIHTAEILRASYSGLLHGVRTSGSLVSRGGVVNGLGNDMIVAQNGSPNMSVNVAPGQCFVPGTEGTKQGTYSCVNDANRNVTITAADGTNPRIDLIVARVQDTQYSGGTNTWSLAVVTGTPAGSPAAPTAPANSLTLAQIAVGAGVTSIVTANITDRRFFAAGLGGRIRASSTNRPATTTVPAGTEIYEPDTGLVRTLYGSSWLLSQPYRQDNTLGSAANSVAFSSIPTTLKRLRVHWAIRGDAASSGILLSRINSNSGANYHYQTTFSFNTTVGASAGISQTSWNLGNFPVGSGTGTWACGSMDIIGWDAPHANYLCATSQSGYVESLPVGVQNYSQALAYIGSSASGYTSISLFQAAGNFQTGSRFSVEGWD